jgi:hypothetical protein
VRRDFDEPPTVERQLPEGWPLLATLSEPQAASDAPAVDTVRPPPPQPEPAASAPPPLPPAAPAPVAPPFSPWPGVLQPARASSAPPQPKPTPRFESTDGHLPRRPFADRLSPVPVEPLLIAEVIESAPIVRAEPERMVAIEEDRSRYFLISAQARARGRARAARLAGYASVGLLAWTLTYFALRDSDTSRCATATATRRSARPDW